MVKGNRPCWHTVGSLWAKRLRKKSYRKNASCTAYEKYGFVNKPKTDF